MNDNKMIRGVKLINPDGDWLFVRCDDEKNDVDFLISELRAYLENGEIDDKYIIQITEITEEQYDELGEFDGF